ncbi:hypothetical protein IT084_14895 [Desulfallas sp. Bu1-1]|uniref:hypothetical protein n=1 Tax=Desulfallas sp. Bu1-1 TaxID=2787620 RepID=UPI00189CFA95|nr:hypothetical protein [Desulfallas sp. Bu1-1]MBF7084239.1 hypothetical protein [Desulfallas sp. Bu1-1]
MINAGSAGKPKHGDPRAVYALIEIDGNIQVDFIKVSYDHESAVRAVEKAGLPAEFATSILYSSSCIEFFAQQVLGDMDI